MELCNDPRDRFLCRINFWRLFGITNDVLNYIQLILGQIFQRLLLHTGVIIDFLLELESSKTKLEFVIPAET